MKNNVYFFPIEDSDMHVWKLAMIGEDIQNQCPSIAAATPNLPYTGFPELLKRWKVSLSIVDAWLPEDEIINPVIYL